MFDFPHWVPHKGGLYRRGLELNSSNQITWAFVREGEARTQSVFVDMPGLSFTSLNPAVAEAKYLPGGSGKHYPVKITPKGAGTTTIIAMNGVWPAALDVGVYQQRSLTVAFKNVKTTGWTANGSDNYAQHLIDTANALYRYQGNLVLKKHGSVSTVEIAGLGAVVDRGTAAGFESWSCHVSGVADITCFFVSDYENSSAGGSQWAGQHREWMVFEPSIDRDMAGMVFAHEMGHFFGLNHPSPPLPENLLNQSSAGDRHRYKSYLNRQQIETVTDRGNWDNKNVNVCMAGKAAGDAVKTMLKNFGF